jgi:hypothetical protein
MILYAEMHFPSGVRTPIWRSQPELIVDIPWLIARGRDVPVMFLAKDAHRYPITFERMVVVVRSDARQVIRRSVFDVGREISDPLWMYMVSLPPLDAGEYDVEAVIEYSLGGHRFRAHADNYRRTSGEAFPLRVLSGDYPLPDPVSIDGQPAVWLSGDAHVHTSFTRDQIEFGPPVEAIAQMAEASGLDWCALTDHSYDLDDREDDYTRNDPTLPRWNGFLREVDECRARHPGVTLIAGEEVSCGNARGRNVHLLAYGIREYIPGSGDSGEWPFRSRPDLSITEVIERVQRQGGLAVASHPGEYPPIHERLLIRRDQWRDEDVSRDGLSALQVWNGRRGEDFLRGMEMWVSLLLSGRRIPIIGGNDSHGAFGRSRHIHLPWLSIGEGTGYLFGNVRTVVAAKSRAVEDILASIAAGRCYVTDGPALDIQPMDGGVRITARSCVEFGGVTRICVGTGVMGDSRERWQIRELSGNPMEAEWIVPLDVKKGYARAEVRTTSGRSALTNPVMLSST